jgi:hypothetical protein
MLPLTASFFLQGSCAADKARDDSRIARGADPRRGINAENQAQYPTECRASNAEPRYLGGH